MSSQRRSFRTLNIVDDYTRQCLAIELDTSLPGERVTGVLDRLVESGMVESGHRPAVIVVYKGPEFALNRDYLSGITRSRELTILLPKLKYLLKRFPHSLHSFAHPLTSPNCSLAPALPKMLGPSAKVYASLLHLIATSFQVTAGRI